jgi:hypothetical protein
MVLPVLEFPNQDGSLLAVLVTLGGGNLVFSFLLESNMKNVITNAPPVQRVKGSPGLLLVQMHKSEARTPPRHYVCSQADRYDSTKLREQPIQTSHCRTRGQILHHHLSHNYS